MEIFRPYRILAVLTFCLVVILAAVHAAQAYPVSAASLPAKQASDDTAPEGANPAPSCRYGVVTLGNDQVPYVDVLGAGWYINFSINAADASNGAEFAHVIRVNQNKNGATYLPGYTTTPALTDAGMGAQIASNPGALWIVGNEIDRGPDPGETESVQDDIHAGVYAEAYHEAYNFIKQRDPSALISPSALVQVTPGRIQYLNMMYNAYLDKFGQPMPADFWNMHLYILPEVLPDGSPNGIASIALGTDPALGISEPYDPDGAGPLGAKDSCQFGDVYCYAEHDSMEAFREQIVRMRQWMADHGYRNRPLLLSEYSLLLPYAYPNGDPFSDEFGERFTPERVQAFMTNTFDYLSTASDPELGFPADNNKLVQQWLWFSVHNFGVGQVSNLINNPTSGTLSNLGQTFRNRVASQAPTVNLYPDRASSLFAFTNITGTVDVTLEAEVGNNGTASAGAFQVTFYSNQGLTNMIGTPQTIAAQAMTGCGTRNITVSVPWSGLGPGLHYFWVKVDSLNAVGETSETDNVRRGSVYVDPELILLPAISGG